MPRTLSLDVLAEKDKSYNRPIELYRIYLDEATLYLAMYPKDIDFFDEQGNPQTYYAAALERSAVETNIDTKIDQCKVTIDNVTREMSAYIAATEFVGRRMQIFKVLLDANMTNPNNKIIVFDGIMDSPKINQYQMAVTVVSKLDKLDRKLPARTYCTNCPWIFGGEECGVTKPTITGVIDSIGVNYLTINSASITGVAGYWNFGEITISKETRQIEDSGPGYVTVEYPFSTDVEVGGSYTIVAGCDKSYDAGHGCTFWSNTDFYGGFLAIPKIRNIREVL